MKSLQFICKKQAINFAPLQSAKGHKCSSKENGELNQDNKILLVPTWALNLNPVTVGNGPAVCPCTATTSTIKRKGMPHNLRASHAASLVKGRKSPSKLFPFLSLEKRFMLCHINALAYGFVQELLLKLQSQDTRACFGFKQEGATGFQMMWDTTWQIVLIALVINVLILLHKTQTQGFTITDPFAAVNHSNRVPMAWSISHRVHHHLEGFNISFHRNLSTHPYIAVRHFFFVCFWGDMAPTEELGVRVSVFWRNIRMYFICSPSAPCLLVLGRHLHA